MWTKIFRAINIIVIITMPVLIVYQLFFAEKTDVKLVAKAVSLLVVYLLAMLRIRRKTSPLDYLVFEEQYKSILGKAFSQDKDSYRKLMKAISLYNANKQEKSLEILEKLYNNCSEPDDYTAVLCFKALNLDELKRTDEAIACYEEALTRDRTRSTVWSNLGILYKNNGRNDDAVNAYREAIAYDPENAFAYNNIANIYLLKGDAQETIAYGLKAIELNPKMHQSMSALAVAYKMEGNMEKALEYRRMYEKNGGDPKVMKLFFGE